MKGQNYLLFSGKMTFTVLSVALAFSVGFGIQQAHASYFDLGTPPNSGSTGANPGSTGLNGNDSYYSSIFNLGTPSSAGTTSGNTALNNNGSYYSGIFNLGTPQASTQNATVTPRAIGNCTPNASQRCVGNAVYSFDSCGNQQNIVKSCLPSQTCSNGTCGRTVAAGPIGNIKATFLSHSVDSNGRYVSNWTVQNLDSTPKTVQFREMQCRCQQGMGNPTDACEDYYPSTPTWAGGDAWLNGFCNITHPSLTLGPNETKTVPLEVSQYQNQYCGSFQLDAAIESINGIPTPWQGNGTSANYPYTPMLGSFLSLSQDCGQIAPTPTPTPVPNPAPVCGDTRMFGSPAGNIAGITVTPVASSATTNGIVSATFEVKNTSNLSHTLTYDQYLCRCADHAGTIINGHSVCGNYWDPTKNPANGLCVPTSSSITLSAGASQQIQNVVTQYNNTSCGSVQTDLVLTKMDGVPVSGAPYLGASFVDSCQSCSAPTPTPTITCSTNSQCGTNTLIGNPFCQGGSVFQNYKTFTCNNPGTAYSSCSDSTAPQLQTNCTGNTTCSNGSCINNTPNLAVSCSVNPTSANTNQAVNFNATASGGTGSYSYQWLAACSGNGQNCSNTFSNPGIYTALLAVTSGNQTQYTSCNVNINQVVNPTCTTNSQCGTNAFTGSEFCQNGSVYQNYKTYTCNNAGTASATCSDSTAPQLKTTCTGNTTCSNGACVNQTITCSTNSQCGTNVLVGNPFCQGGSVYQNYKTFTCNNAGTPQSSCSDSTSPQLQNTCTGNQTCGNGTCNNNTPALAVTCVASPSSANTNQAVTYASTVSGGTGSYTYQWTAGCTGNGSTCTNTYTTQGSYTALLAVTSGTQIQYASCNVAVSQVATPICSTNSQCGTNTLVGSPFCQGANIYQNYKTFTCNNPGTVNSSCSDSTAPQLQTNCTGNTTCSNGTCTNNNPNLVVSVQVSPTSANTNQSITYTANVSGGNGSYSYQWSAGCIGSGSTCTTTYQNQGSYTALLVVTSGTQTQYASGTVTINQVSTGACSTNSQCGTNSITGSPFCQNNGVYQNYINYTCNNPGTAYSTCSQNITQQLQTTCGYGQTCSNGYCSTNSVQQRLTVTKEVKNLSSNDQNWYGYVNALSGNTVLFRITIYAPTSQNNVVVRDNIPSGITYLGNLTVDGGIYSSGNIMGSGLNIGNMSAGQTVIVTYQARVN